MNSPAAAAMTTPSPRPPVQKHGNIVVLGLGNILLTDEGAGVHVLQQLAQTHAARPDLMFLDGGTLSFTLAESIVTTDALIVIDTASLRAPAGTVQVFEGDAMDRFISTGERASVHEVSLADLLAIAALEGLLPQRRALVGIQPQDFGWGDWPSPEVAAAIPAAGQAVMELVERWQSCA